MATLQENVSELADGAAAGDDADADGSRWAGLLLSLSLALASLESMQRGAALAAEDRVAAARKRRTEVKERGSMLESLSYESQANRQRGS